MKNARAIFAITVGTALTALFSGCDNRTDEQIRADQQKRFEENGFQIVGRQYRQENETVYTLKRKDHDNGLLYTGRILKNGAVIDIKSIERAGPQSNP